jgi:hypothetical protein
MILEVIDLILFNSSNIMYPQHWSSHENIMKKSLLDYKTWYSPVKLFFQ